MSDLIIRAGAGAVITDITPESAGWRYSGLTVVELRPGETRAWSLDADEAGLLPLRGSVDATLTPPDGTGDAVRVTLARSRPWWEPADFAYAPRGASIAVTAGPQGARLAVARARAEGVREVQVLRAADVASERRGAGDCSRLVHAYTIDTAIAVDRLLVCEVLTPGGNTSSYPPHKHDEHSERERELEEIYYFEVADSPAGPGVGYHRTYGTTERPIDVLAEVRSGDVALVPHGYHGPCVALPGHDMYYLNVMAGPLTDARWLATDDPHFAWIRDTWASQSVDPRLEER
ncbi:MAG: 5-deoxy-glucuronate isomerase [Propionibacteriaceae bacterium]|nr:5-deoxy-glucuronate isomerase [Propionibacteriaceae bacterium]